jgi:hypothetical protein
MQLQKNTKKEGLPACYFFCVARKQCANESKHRQVSHYMLCMLNHQTVEQITTITRRNKYMERSPWNIDSFFSPPVREKF